MFSNRFLVDPSKVDAKYGTKDYSFIHACRAQEMFFLGKKFCELEQGLITWKEQNEAPEFLI